MLIQTPGKRGNSKVNMADLRQDFRPLVNHAARSFSLNRELNLDDHQHADHKPTFGRTRPPVSTVAVTWVFAEGRLSADMFCLLVLSEALRLFPGILDTNTTGDLSTCLLSVS